MLNLDLLKITKVKLWSIDFKYNSSRYLLHGFNDDEQGITLYRKEVNKLGQYDLTYLYSIYGSPYFAREYLNYYKKNIIYSHIDKEYFEQQLIKNKFINYIK